MSRAQKLLLFDIDGTLISPGPRPREWFSAAIREVTNQAIDLQLKDVMGSTDPLIILNSLKRLGYSNAEIEALAPQILEGYTRRMHTDYLADDSPRFIYPGVQELLRILESHIDCTLGLVTGNLQSIAQLKLEHFGLWQYFPIGGFSSDAAIRSELPHIARKRANALNDQAFKPEHCVIIGDTLGDLEAGRASGMPVVLVGNGRDSKHVSSLKQSNPDLYLDNFTDSGAFLDFLDTLDEL